MAHMHTLQKKVVHPLRAAIYTRVSSDKRRGTALEAISTSSQEREGRAVIQDKGWRLIGMPYCDNDISASPYATKEREDWPRLLEDLKSDAFDVLLIWESSRGSRTLSEWALFLETARHKGVLIHVISHERTYDVRRSRDWKTLASDGVEAEHSSNETSDRVRRLKSALRAEGRPDGQFPFGWRRRYDPRTRVLLEQIPEPDEVQAVLEAIDRLHAGESIIQVASDFNCRTSLDKDDPMLIPLRRGWLWRPDTVRRTALNPTHVGKIPRLEFYSDFDRLPDAQWAPLISPQYGTGTADEEAAFVAKWRELSAALHAPERRRARPGGAKYWLAGLAVCGVCQGIMGVKWNQRKDHSYCCRGIFANGTPTDTSGCASVKMAWADDVIYKLLVERLSMGDLIDPATAQDDAAAVAAQAHAAQLQASLDEALDQATALNISWDTYAKAEARLLPKIEAALETAREKDAVVLPVFRSFARCARGIERDQARLLVAEMLDGMQIAQKRELVRGVFDAIWVRKGRRGIKVFDPSRIVYRWSGCGVHAGAGREESCALSCLDLDSGPAPAG